MSFLDKLFGCFHDWVRWSEPIEGVATQYGEKTDCWIQQRTCQKCGKIELRRISQ
jgi:hypothetical protein